MIKKSKALNNLKIKKIIKLTSGKRHVWILAETKKGEEVKVRKEIKNVNG